MAVETWDSGNSIPLPGELDSIRGFYEDAATARSYSAPKLESGNWPMEKIQAYTLPGTVRQFRAEATCSAITMAVCGSELLTKALCMYTREGQTRLRNLTVSPATIFLN